MKLFGRTFNFWEPTGFEEFAKAGGHADSGCPSVVGNGAKWAVEILLEQ